MKDIESIDSELGTWLWDPSCAGEILPAGCHLRESEVTTVMYQPFECDSSTNGACDQVIFSIRKNLLIMNLSMYILYFFFLEIYNLQFTSYSFQRTLKKEHINHKTIDWVFLI